MTRTDIVIFGATGFTGKYAVEEMVNLSHKYPEITWAVAGRSNKKLRDVLEEISLKTGDNITNIKTITADVKDYKSLIKMCSEARVIANCCGPYFKVGEPVVQAAIASKTHYVDVAAEPLFMESMQLQYDKQASDARVYIISACGVDSIANDMGVIFLEENFKGTLNSIEAYLSLDTSQEFSGDIRKYGMIHKTSWDSLLSSMLYRDKLKATRKKLYSDPLPSSKVILQDKFIHRRENHFCAKIPNPDESVVYRTQRHLYTREQKRPVQFKYYYTFRNIIEALLVVIGVVIINFITKFSLLSKPLLNNPKLFTLGMMTDDGPTEKVMDNTKLHFDLYGEGWSGMDEGKPDKTMVTKVSMINPYRASVVAQNFAALTILKDIDRMPGSGGVLTPGVAFRSTDLIRRLNDNGMKFEITKS